jgi:5-methylcytosine-specific restriction endonuclease McrA
MRGAWVRFVWQQNMDTLGETADLNEFLFGSERASLAAVRPVLMELQRGACFDCGSALTAANMDVDHFIAWARYPVDLGHNFVLADRACNNKKRDLLPAIGHLAERILSREECRRQGKILLDAKRAPDAVCQSSEGYMASEGIRKNQPIW